MRPLLYSVKDAEQHGMGWYREGTNIAYYQNSRKSKSAAKLITYRGRDTGARHELSDSSDHPLDKWHKYLIK
jgi:hypothetical protein